MRKVSLELTLEEADLVSAVVCRDRDRVLDDAFGNRGTRLITDQEEALVPKHQEVLRKIETSITTLTTPPAPIHEAIDAIVGVVDAPGSSGSEADTADLGKIRELCESFSVDALHVAIRVHRGSCHQSNCPVLAVMVETAKRREPKHPWGCACNDCEHFRAEHGS